MTCPAAQMPARSRWHPVLGAPGLLLMLPGHLWVSLWFDALIWPLHRRGWNRSAWMVTQLAIVTTMCLSYVLGLALNTVLLDVASKL